MINNIRSLFTIKYGALALLVLQNTFLVVYMGYSRQLKGPMYASSSAVTTMEVVKLFTCLSVITLQQGGFKALFLTLNEEIVEQPFELVKLAVPSLLYTVQNNLLYFALSHLDAATFQVGYQVKILTTAVFSVLMLGKSISRLQWVSLVILTIGVSLAQLSAHQKAAAEGAANVNSTYAGFMAVLLAAVISGFSGVYFEKILKNSQTTLWMRNIQMSMSSIIISLICVRFSSQDYALVTEKGFFYGYSYVVWFVIFLQAVGGLVVAVVVKYADNILKGFAASISIVTSSILCMVFFAFKPSSAFVLGAVLVNYSVYLYSYQPAVKKMDVDDTNSNATSKEGNNSRDNGNSSNNNSNNANSSDASHKV